jgi:endogenous inhibitor of DNA gyrase (YacG/DUF329 family)
MPDRLTVECPTCSRPAEYSPRNRWRPFCSERCRGVDLGAWASERFRIASQPDPAGADSDAAAQTDANPTPRG